MLGGIYSPVGPSQSLDPHHSHSLCLGHHMKLASSTSVEEEVLSCCAQETVCLEPLCSRSGRLLVEFIILQGLHKGLKSSWGKLLSTVDESWLPRRRRLHLTPGKALHIWSMLFLEGYAVFMWAGMWGIIRTSSQLLDEHVFQSRCWQVRLSGHPFMPKNVDILSLLKTRPGLVEFLARRGQHLLFTASPWHLWCFACMEKH